MSLTQPLNQEVIRTFKIHFAWFPVERIMNAMEQNLNRENIMKVWEGLHHSRYHRYRKNCESHQPQNNKFLLEETVSRCCEWLHRIYNRASQRHNGRDCGNGKVGRKLRLSRYGSWRNSRANRYNPWEMNRRWLGNESFWTNARQWERRHRSSSARKQTDIEQPGRRVLINQDCFDFFL